MLGIELKCAVQVIGRPKPVVLLARKWGKEQANQLSLILGIELKCALVVLLARKWGKEQANQLPLILGIEQ